MIHMQKHYLLLAILAFVLASGCTPSGQKETAIPVASFNQDRQVRLTEIPFEQAKTYYQDAASQVIFRGISGFTAQNMRNMHVLAKFGPDLDHLTSGPNAVLKPGESLTGILLLVDTLKEDYRFGVLAAIDGQPSPILFNQAAQNFPRLDLRSGSQTAFEFSLPPLPEGLHTLTINFIIEPDRFFSFDPTNQDLTKFEAISWRNSPMELDLLIWVTGQTPQKANDWPEEARSILPEDASSFGGEPWCGINRRPENQPLKSRTRIPL